MSEPEKPKVILRKKIRDTKPKPKDEKCLK